MGFKINFEEISMPPAQLRQPRTLSPKEKSKLAKWNVAKSGRLIRQAAKIMADKGVSRGFHHSPEGAFCIRGATNYAWSGNPNLTDSFVYLNNNLTPSYTPRPFGGRHSRNIEVIQALSDFREYLMENGLGDAVEGFNDGTGDPEEIIRWMHKFADEKDPKK